ncbi:spermidine/putrescine ABC transporter substrate-binding protein [Pseudomonas sp. S25]|uniref:Spermidine/putrescine ABC transporter substrate-binding protein n=1 Tax=Pseudomonas maioricensis TaxID=1766623 RepID=A0ABS9ZKT0_9PSED|nr:polyamine ABC transporter substrate-binding protein [Pseudomonas sp. S25]MCI8211183.1 spermidine/putrescine ABC transporter substrate-binding protein [Pseudomonas sp. S25]
MFAKAFVPLMLVTSMSQAAPTVKIFNWTDYFAPDTLTNFQKETGIAATYDTYERNETLDEILKTGHSGYDIVVPSSHFLARQIERGNLQKLDKSQLPNWKNLNPVLLQALANVDPGNAYAFPYLWGTTGIGYNAAKVQAVLGKDMPLNSWDLIFKPENLKKLSQCGVAMVDSAASVVPIALNYLNLPPDSTNAADYPKAKAALRAVRPYVRYFNSTDYITDLASGKICVAVGYSGDVMLAQHQAQQAGKGVEINYALPREGSPMWFDMMAIPADAPNQKAAYAFMNYVLNPKVISGISNYLHYANGNEKAEALVEASVHNDTAIYPDAETLSTLFALQAIPADIETLRSQVWAEVKAEQ